jgi:hypothetical protein
MSIQKIIKLSILIIFISCLSNSNERMTNKKFSEPDNTAVFTTRFVTDKKEITHVTHEKEDGAWQFFSDDQFDNFESVAKIVGLGEIIKMDSTIHELADMPLGYEANRKFKGDKWIMTEIKP